MTDGRLDLAVYNYPYMSSLSARAGALLACGALALVIAAPGPAAQSPTPADRARAHQRASERIRSLLREAEALAAQQSRLLTELKGLEADRQARAGEVASIDRRLSETHQQLAASVERAATLRKDAESERPDVEARLVQLYKLGRVGYWRMLMDVDDLRALGRAYRHAAALNAIDRERLLAHQRTLQALDKEQKDLQGRAAKLEQLQTDARRARTALDRAVRAHTALIDSIDVRRDLNAQMSSELQAAQQRLQNSMNAVDGEATPATTLPVEAFQGALPWPARGRIANRFGRETSSRFGTAVVRNGIEIAVPEGRRVNAVHEGTVRYADEFTGYGTLVIVEHGGGAFSLYGHLGSVQVALGDRVEAGTTLGLSGKDPGGTPSVYFELRIDARPVDPLQWLQKGTP
jgi:septal ring factor EnvC (AmiA/AmiB activator)